MAGGWTFQYEVEGDATLIPLGDGAYLVNMGQANEDPAPTTHDLAGWEPIGHITEDLF